MSIQAIAFDAYGTLFDVYSIAELADKLFPGQGQALARLWRSKQIEYTHLRTMCSMYKPFWEVTQDALLFSCQQLGLPLGLEQQNALMGQYARLQVFPEVRPVLAQLQELGVKLSILSNGTPEMLSSMTEAAGIRSYFSHLLSVDSVKKYKTAPEAYQMGPDVFGVAAREILFVSSNGWDICGASWFGYTGFWVNRAAAPPEQLGVRPAAEGRTLNDLLPFVRRHRDE